MTGDDTAPDIAELTAIVIVLVGGDATERCLASIARTGVTAIVVAQDGSVWREGRHCAGPSVRNVPMRRQVGITAATTPYVALIEDTAQVAPEWASRIVAALAQPGVGAVGGPVAISAMLPARSRALGLTEYGRFQRHRFARLKTGVHTTAGDEAVRLLAGIDFAFRRDAVLMAMAGQGLFDHETFARLSEAGLAMVYQPSMQVTYAHAHDSGSRLTTRFDHGRIYGAQRLAGAAMPARLAAAAKSLALPAVLLARSLNEAAGPLLRSPATLGWVALQHLAWSLGELTAALAGADRDGLERWQ